MYRDSTESEAALRQSKSTVLQVGRSVLCSFLQSFQVSVLQKKTAAYRVGAPTRAMVLLLVALRGLESVRVPVKEAQTSHRGPKGAVDARKNPSPL